MEDDEASSIDTEPDHLARLAATGDRAAVEAFLRAISPPVVRFCRSKLIGSSGTQTADDVAQEVLMAVCESLPRFRLDGSSVMAFVFGIARYKLVDAFRASGRDRSTPSESVPDTADLDPGPEFAAILSTETARLKLALAQLPEHHREVLVMRVALGYSAAEVARILGTTPGAVRVTQHRVLVKLRALLAEQATPED